MAVMKTHFKDFKDAEKVLGDNEIKELEEIFAKDEPKADDAKPKEEVKKKETAATVLDPKRLQNTSIFLQSQKIDVPALREAILTLDEDKLTPEFTIKLLDNLPEPDEITAIQGWLEANGDRIEKMSAADQYFHKMGQIDQVRTRLECFNFKQTFASKVAEIKPALLRVKQATTSMKANSDNFLKVCEVVLAVGNFLNSGTNNGNANGFNIRTLTKLDSLKGVDKATSLLTYIVKFIEKKYPDTAAKWSQDLAPIEYATKIDFEGVLTDLGEIKRNLLSAEQKVPTVKKADERWDVFYKLMPQAIENLKGDMAELEELSNKVQEEFKALVVSFGEDGAKAKPEEFFGIIKQFLDSWEKEKKESKLKEIADEKEAKKKELEAKKAAKLKELEEKRKAKEARENKTEPSAEAKGGAKKEEPAKPAEPDPSNTLDAALGSMKSGRAFERRRLRRQDTLRQKREQEAKMRGETLPDDDE